MVPLKCNFEAKAQFLRKVKIHVSKSRLNTLQERIILSIDPVFVKRMRPI
jgi:hypothetical protein